MIVPTGMELVAFAVTSTAVGLKEVASRLWAGTAHSRDQTKKMIFERRAFIIPLPLYASQFQVKA